MTARPSQDLEDARLLSALEPRVAELVHRHVAVAKEWFPHEYIPYGLGRDYEKEPWTPDQPRLTGVARTAFEVNLLTEDNLPSYHRLIHTLFWKGDGAWKNWVHRWTAEEGRHAIVIRDYLVVTRNIDPVSLERGRMQTTLAGYDRPMRPANGLAYGALQELATRISHQNAGKYSDDPVADRIMMRVAADENLHMVFYRDAVAAALESDASLALQAIANEIATFQMPGYAIRGFARKAARVAEAGIYDLRIHLDEIVRPLLRYWKVFDLRGLSDAAERSREELARFLETLEGQARRYEERREARRRRAENVAL